MPILVNISGIFLIAFIIWWFWLSKGPKSILKAEDQVEIRVKDSVYQPAIIQVKIGQPITLRFIREDPQPCAETVVFNSLNISKSLPLNQPVDIKITLSKAGEHEFTCQMGMYRGKIIAR